MNSHRENRFFGRRALIGICGLILVTGLVSCAKKWELSNSQPTNFQQAGGSAGFGGETYVTSITTTSTVVSVDTKTRTLHLKNDQGKITAYKAGPEVSNFAGIKVGDEVEAIVADECAVGLVATGTKLSSSNQVVTVRSPSGGPPMSVNTRVYIAVLVSADSMAHTVTLRLADGTLKNVKVNENIDLSNLSPGAEITVQLSEARTFTVEKK